MSSPSSKSQSQGPLHNFSLAEPKWSSSYHRGRRLGEPSPPQATASNAAIVRHSVARSQQSRSPFAETVRRSAAVDDQSPSGNAAVIRPTSSDAEQRLPALRVVGEGSDRAFSSSNSEHASEKISASQELREKISNRITGLRIKNKPVEAHQEQEDEEEGRKTWNLRPRNPRGKTSTSHKASFQGEAALPLVAENGESKDLANELRWPKFSLTLTPQEIEDDIFAMTGSRPSRKPRRRPKAVQEGLDRIFPGMWLESVTPDSYKVPESSKKKKK